jgi:hypothetical protein
LKSTAAETAARFGVSTSTVARVRAIADRSEAGDRTAEDALLAGKSIKAAAALARAGRRKRRLRRLKRQQGRRPARQLVLKAPFSYPGGKGGAAAIVWPLLGEDVRIYIEPFAGSLAVLLARRVPPRIETCNDPTMLFANFRRVPDHDLSAVADGFLEVANDLDPYIVNAWRSIQQSPVETAAWCGDIGVDECLSPARRSARRATWCRRSHGPSASVASSPAGTPTMAPASTGEWTPGSSSPPGGRPGPTPAGSGGGG